MAEDDDEPPQSPPLAPSAAPQDELTTRAAAAGAAGVTGAAAVPVTPTRSRVPMMAAATEESLEAHEPPATPLQLSIESPRIATAAEGAADPDGVPGAAESAPVMFAMPTRGGASGAGTQRPRRELYADTSASDEQDDG